MVQEPNLLGSGLDHRQDAGLEGLGQVGPGGYDGGQVGVNRAPALPTAHRLDARAW